MPLVVRAPLGFFDAVGPARRLRGRGFQAADVLLQLFVAAVLKLVLPRAVFGPGGKIPLLNLYAGTVDGQDMVHAAVQKRPVVRNEDKPLFPVQVPAQNRARLHVQVVGRLVDQQKISLPRKQGAEQNLCLLAAAERIEGPVQDFVVRLQHGQLPLDAPHLAAGLQPFQRIGRE